MKSEYQPDPYYNLPANTLKEATDSLSRANEGTPTSGAEPVVSEPSPEERAIKRLVRAGYTREQAIFVLATVLHEFGR